MWNLYGLPIHGWFHIVAWWWFALVNNKKTSLLTRIQGLYISSSSLQLCLNMGGIRIHYKSNLFVFNWLVVSTPSEKYESNWESSPKFGVKIKNIWNHHPVEYTNPSSLSSIVEGAQIQTNISPGWEAKPFSSCMAPSQRPKVLTEAEPPPRGEGCNGRTKNDIPY